jgi:phage shock protein PspC (stress-responsive transcriptional regulator)
MNKIIIINLGGRSIQIEEDAYDELRNYLQQLEKQFIHTESGKDIIDDIEARISEMLTEKMKDGKSSVNLTDVRDVIRIMGRPADLDEEQTADYKSENEPYEGKVKRLFRDSDQRVIGGVCSGIAQYFSIDVTIVRIIWILSFFMFGTGFLVYLILWVVIPKANTTAEKLQMKGEMPTIDNIRKSVTDEAQRAMKSMNDYARSGKVRSGIQELIYTIGRLLRPLFVFVAAIVSIAVIIGIVAIASYMLFGVGSLHINGESITINELPKIYASASVFWLVKILVNLVIILPLISLVLKLTDVIFNDRKSIPRLTYQVLGVFWLFAVIGLGSIAVYTVRDFKQQHNQYEEIQLTEFSDTLTIGALDDGKGMMSVFNHRMVNFRIEPSTGNEKLLRIRKSSKGTDEETAAHRTRKFDAVYQWKDGKLEVSNRIDLKGEIYRGQQITYILKVPEGTIIRFHPNTEKMITHETGVLDLFPYEAAGHVFTLTADGLKCIDCFGAETGSEGEMDRFNIVTSTGALKIHIRQSDKDQIEVKGSSEFKNNVQQEVKDGALNLSLRNDWSNNGLSLSADNIVFVTVKDLKRLEASGASQIDISGLKTTLLDLELEGVSSVNMHNVNTEITKVTLDGGGKLTASGNCEKMVIDLSGTAMVDAFEYACDVIDLDIDGAGKCNLNARRKITGSVNGVAKVNYKGGAVVQTRNSGAVKVTKVD